MSVRNDRSWIVESNCRRLVQIELASKQRFIDASFWGRDRQGDYGDSSAYRGYIESAIEPGQWEDRCPSSDRQPYPNENASRERVTVRRLSAAGSRARQGLAGTMQTARL